MKCENFPRNKPDGRKCMRADGMLLHFFDVSVSVWGLW